MANLHRLLTAIFFSLAFCSPAFSQSAPVGAIDLAGWIKGADGAYTKAFGESAKITLSSPPSGISTTSTALINTSKGIQAMDIVKTAAVDVNRVGAAVGKLAQRVGPVGMTLTAVSLVCELSSICNDAGQWMFGSSEADQVAGLVGGWVVNYDSSPLACAPDVDGRGCASSYWGSSFNIGGFSYTIEADRINAEVRLLNKTTGADMGAGKLRKLISNFTPQPIFPATEANWESKSSLLNDDRFIPELIGKGESVPSNVPTLIPDQKKGLGLESKPTRDSSGNVTGREDTTTEIEAVDAGTTDNPGRVIIKETQTTIKYDINNNQINTTTNTSYSSQPQPDKPQQNFEIKFDEVPPA
ncbi:hypothetical protein, partial [Nitrosomonas ureae]